MVELFNIAENGGCLIVDFSSSLSNVDKAIEEAMGFLHRSKIVIDNFRLRLLLHEGLTNAAVHGNKLDSDKMVSFAVSAECDRLKITISDDGPGFRPDYDISENNGHETHGRGLFLMKAYSDNVSYDSSENELLITVTL